jgi:hypothetical protein
LAVGNTGRVHTLNFLEGTVITPTWEEISSQRNELLNLVINKQNSNHAVAEPSQSNLSKVFSKATQLKIQETNRLVQRTNLH